MNQQLLATKSKRQFYRVLQNAAEETLRKIESTNTRSKKRKIADDFTESVYNDNTNHNILLTNFVQESDIDSKNKTQNNTHNTSNLNSSDCMFNEDTDIFDSDFLSRDEDCLVVSKFHDLVNENINNDICEENINKNINTYLQNSLKIWAIEYNIPRNSFKELLKILNKVCPNLSLDPRSIFQKSNNIPVEIMGDGEYYNFGLKNMLEKHLKLIRQPSSQIIWLKFNVDGLPLFKSSRVQFWPILCLISNLNFQPFVCAAYCGKGKPDLTLFMKDFIPELKDLMNNGIIINNIKFKIIVKSFICDAPARAFLKGIKGHGGYYGCERCIQKGKWKKGRIIFPNHTSDLRTDESFAKRTQKKHHKEISPLVDIDIKMITMFPLDAMHLIYLGVMRKLLHEWTSGKLKTRLSAINISIISKQLEKTASLWPHDFNRKPRSLHELNMWKATEYRQFLLYLGPIVLTQWLPTKIYQHFLLLHVSIFILSQNVISPAALVQAEHMLKQFVINGASKELYGKTFLIYNVHSLLHLIDDIKCHGSVHEFSAFPFENKLYSLKRAIRGKNKPLQQLVNRTMEITETNTITYNHNNIKDGPVVSSIHSAGISLSLSGIQYKKIQWNNTILSLKERDNTVITSKYDVVRIINFIDTASGIFVIGKRFEKYRDLYTVPCKSSDLNIYVVQNLCEQLNKWHISNILYKAILVKYKNKNTFVSFPMHK